MTTYKLELGPEGIATSIRRSDGWSIPFDPMNSDYIEYLKWVAEGGVPLPPDSQE